VAISPAAQHNLSNLAPNIQVQEVDLRGDLSIRLRHTRHDQIPLAEDDAKEVIKHWHHLWRFDVHLESMQDGSLTPLYICDDESVRNAEDEQTDAS
jgi:stage V sporulation protein R